MTAALANMRRYSDLRQLWRDLSLNSFNLIYDALILALSVLFTQRSMKLARFRCLHVCMIYEMS